MSRARSTSSPTSIGASQTCRRESVSGYPSPERSSLIPTFCSSTNRLGRSTRPTLVTRSPPPPAMPSGSPSALRRRACQVRRRLSSVLNSNQFGQDLRSVSFESLDQTSLSPSQTIAYTAGAVHEAAIAVGRSTISVRFSRASAAAAFAERFGDMLGHCPPDVVIYAVALNGEAYFWRSPDRVRRWSEDPSDELLV